MMPWEKYSGSNQNPWEKYAKTVSSEPSLATQASQYIQKQPAQDYSNWSSAANTLGEVLRPPMIKDILNPAGFIEGKRQALEGASNTAREAAKSIVNPPIESLADKYLPSYLAKGVKVALPFAEHLAAWSPSDFATQAALAIGGPNMDEMATSIANRWANAPKWIREPRWEKGQTTVGRDVLDISKSGEVPGIASNNKDVAANASKLAIKDLSNKINSKIDEVSKAGIPPENIAPTIKSNLEIGQKVPTNGIKTQDIADSIDSEIEKLDAPDAEALTKFKEGWLRGKPEYLNFKQLNQERVKLGEELGKDFGKISPELSNKATAQRIMWEKIRNHLSQKSPELDEMLSLQHKLIDIKNSLKPEAALGYSKTTPIDWVGSPIDAFKKATIKNVGLADFLNKNANLVTYAGMGIGASGKSVAEQLGKKNQ